MIEFYRQDKKYIVIILISIVALVMSIIYSFRMSNLNHRYESYLSQELSNSVASIVDATRSSQKILERVIQDRKVQHMDVIELGSNFQGISGNLQMMGIINLFIKSVDLNNYVSLKVTDEIESYFRYDWNAQFGVDPNNFVINDSKIIALKDEDMEVLTQIYQLIKQYVDILLEYEFISIDTISLLDQNEENY